MFYVKNYSYVCFNDPIIPDDDLNAHIYDHFIFKNEKFHRLSISSFICKDGDLSCYDKIANVMNVIVDSIIPIETKNTIIEIKRNCENEYGTFYYPNGGVNYFLSFSRSR